MGYKVPAGITSRHVHLQEDHFKTLFGENAELTVFKDVSQPGQYAANEKVTIVGPKNSIANVRVLGPLRGQTQVELSVTDCISTGIPKCLRDSGDLKDSSPCKLIGPAGEVELTEGAIVCKRHIHLAPDQAEEAGVKDGDIVSVRFDGERAVVFENVLIRAGIKNYLDMHIDTDEANAANLSNNQEGEIIK